MIKGHKNIQRVKPSGLELTDRVVGIQRVTKVTKGGRTFGFSAIVVVGDENGVAGYGLGKSKEVSEAIQKGIEDAKKKAEAEALESKRRQQRSWESSSLGAIYKE